MKKQQSKAAMLIIILLIGCLGVHRYLMGYSNWWIFLLLSILTGGIVGTVWAIVDFIRILTGSMKMADGEELSV